MLTETMQFPNAREARDYRRATGCGGYLFEDEDDGTATLIPDHDRRGGSRSHRVAIEHVDVRGRMGALYR